MKEKEEMIRKDKRRKTKKTSICLSFQNRDQMKDERKLLVFAFPILFSPQVPNIHFALPKTRQDQQLSFREEYSILQFSVKNSHPQDVNGYLS